MKNKKTIILVGVILLLVLSIGITFAYFVAGVKKEGNGANTNINTATVEDTVLKVEGSINPGTNNDVYPGHKSISELKVTATGDINTLYNLVWTGTNTLKTTFKYYVYKTESKQTPTITCTKKENLIDGEYHYYEECTNNDFTNLGEIISSGEIKSTSTESTVKLIKNERLQATKSGNTIYYYIVIEYPNEEGNQNLDKTGTFNGTTTVNILKEEDLTLSEMILAANGGESAIKAKGNPDFSKTSCTSDCGEDTTGMWAMEDDYGTSYYFRGSVTNNYVKFGKYASNYSDSTLAGKDMYWRIIRINGDGTIRMIYDGTEYHPNGTSTSNSIAVKSQSFNSSNNNNAHVGYTYATGSKRGTGTNSNAKTQIDTWYTSSGLLSYASYLADSGFCGDRTSTTTSGGIPNNTGGTGTTTTYYGARYRLNTKKEPTLKCSTISYGTSTSYEKGNKADVYTISSTKGNGQLQYPIGLISADEVSVAGVLTSSSNYAYYLYNEQRYWTMSPYYFNGYYAGMWYVNNSGSLISDGVNYATGLRPVINIDPTKINNIVIDSNGVYVIS